MRALIVVSIIWLLLLAGEASLAQSPPPERHPNLSLKIFGEVNAFARQPDGGLLLGGSFSSIDGEPRTNLARLRPDGSLDSDWAPVTDGPVHTLAIDGAGAAYAGGDFLHLNGLARQRLAKLDGTGSGALDPDWHPAANGRVSVLVFDPTTGALFVGGWFSQIDGQARQHLAKLATAGAELVDPQWNPGQNILVEEMVVVPGAVYAGGNGASGPGFSPSIGKFHTNGTGARVDGWVAERGGPYSLAVDPNSGALLVGGNNGRITRLSADTGDISGEWDPASIGAVRFTALVVDGISGTVYAGSTFRIARFSLAGVYDEGWVPSLSGAVRALALGANGSVIAGGTFSEAGGEARLSVASFDAAGNVGAPFDVERAGYANVLARQPNGGVLVAGRFHKADGLTRRGLLRLAPDGMLDPNWNPGPGSDVVHALAVDPNSGDVYVGGEFTEIGGVTRYHLAKLSGGGTGAVDGNWNPSPSELIQEIVVDGVGAVYVAGFFYWYGDTESSIGGQRRNYLAKLSGTGTGAADPDWNPAPSGQVSALALDGNGGLLVGGLFNEIGGQASANLARVSVTGVGAVDPLWSASTNSYVRGLDLDAAGWVYVRGDFTNLSGLPRAGLGRISLNGGVVDDQWNPAPNGRVNGIAIDGTGAVYAGGGFTQIGGLPQNYIAKLSPSGTGAADPRWSPGVSAPGIATVVVDAASATVYAAGTFTHVGAQARNGLVAISPVLFSDGYEAPVP